MESIVHKLKNLASWENPVTSAGSWVGLNVVMLWVCLGESSAFTSLTNLLLIYLVLLKLYLMTSKDAFREEKPLLSEEWLSKTLPVAYDTVNQFIDGVRKKCEKENVSKLALVRITSDSICDS
jgi:hypothetical protein